MVVSGQISQIVFTQSVEPLQALHGFHFSERVQGAIFGIAFVHRANLGKGKQAGPEFVSSPLAGCFRSRGVHFGTRRLRFLKKSASCVSGCQAHEPCGRILNSEVGTAGPGRPRTHRRGVPTKLGRHQPWRISEVNPDQWEPSVETPKPHVPQKTSRRQPDSGRRPPQMDSKISVDTASKLPVSVPWHGYEPDCPSGHWFNNARIACGDGFLETTAADREILRHGRTRFTHPDAG